MHEQSGAEPAITFPGSFAENFLWHHEDLTDNSALMVDKSGSARPPPSHAHTFHSGILSEVQAAASYAFSYPAQMGHIGDAPFTQGGAKPFTTAPREPSITLYCPYEGCHDVIDRMVATIARQQKADVVVLDALELALGEFGSIGSDAGRAINAIYDPIPLPETTASDAERLRIQNVFNAMVSIRRNPESVPQGVKPGESTRRIVYMRDFGSIAPSAKPFMPYLLRALRMRRTGKVDINTPSPSKILPTMLIMGFAKGSNTTNSDLSVLAVGGPTLRKTLPSLDSHLIILENASALSGLSAAFFLRSLAKPSERKSKRFHSKFTSKSELEMDFFASEVACLCIYPEDCHTELFRAFQSRASSKRMVDIQSALMSVHLKEKGAFVCDDPMASILGEDDRISSDHMPLPSVIERISIIALGLSCSGNSDSSPDLKVDSNVVSDAYKVFLENSRTHVSWADKETGKKDEGSKPESKDEEGKKGKGTTDEGKKDPVVEKVKSCRDLSEHEKQLLSCVVDSTTLVTAFEDVCIAPKIIDSLRTIVSLRLRHPTAFQTGILAKEAICGVLLYGPPGTGKTMVCRAIARDCGARMLQVKSSDVTNKWYGESEKYAKSVFTLARRLAPCVIFMDEIDSLFRTRSSDGSRPDRAMITEFMQSMDGLQSANEHRNAGVVVVAATNRPFDLDDAILRRLPTRMMLDLPGDEERKQILESYLKDENVHPDVNLDDIILRTKTYSGSDLKNLCVSAAMASTKDAIGDFCWTPPAPINLGTDVDVPEQSDTPSKAEPRLDRTITAANLAHAFSEVLPSSSTQSNPELYRWHNSFMRGGHSEFVTGTLDESEEWDEEEMGSAGFASLAENFAAMMTLHEKV